MSLTLALGKIHRMSVCGSGGWWRVEGWWVGSGRDRVGLEGFRGKRVIFFFLLGFWCVFLSVLSPAFTAVLIV